MVNDPFDGVSTQDMEQRISSARLGRVNTQIARMRLIDREHYADIGAAVGYDRRTVSRRMTNIIHQLGG